MRVWSLLPTHIFGVRAHGIKYFKHFLGPFLPLAPLMLPIEIISHIARPVSLSMRLLGNISADHAVVLAFFGVIPFLVPVPFLVMGVFVSVVQAVVSHCSPPCTSAHRSRSRRG